MTQTFDLQGTLKHIYDIQTFASGFAKREFVIETADDRYPQALKFECVKDKTAILDTLEIGDTVQVSFDIRGNEFKDKYYVNLNAWKITKTAAGSPAAPVDDRAVSTLDARFDNEPDATDDIPF